MGMIRHDHEFRFCPLCGSRFNVLVLKKNEPARLVCSSCAFIFFLDPKVVSCSITELDNKIVLLKRSIKPQKGKWVMPGGYVERGEEVRAAAIRETREECGLEVRIKYLLGVYSYAGVLPIVVVYVAEHVSGDLIAGDEALETGLFSLAKIPWKELGFQSTTEALTHYCERRKA